MVMPPLFRWSPARPCKPSRSSWWSGLPRSKSFCLDPRPQVMPFRGRHLALDLLVRRPDEMADRYLGGDPIIREALDHGRVLHG